MTYLLQMIMLANTKEIIFKQADVNYAIHDIIT
jgi:hypothetical protein